MRRGVWLIALGLFLLGLIGWSWRQERSATLIAGGDVLLDRGVIQAMERAGDPGYPFRVIAPLLQQADLALANLECPLTQATIPIAKRFSFRADPDMAAELKKAGFTALNLANNHTSDYGRSSVMETKRYLEAEGILAVGAGENQKQAAQARYVEVHGIKIALLGFVDMPLEGLMPLAEMPGPAFASPELVKSAIRKARRHSDRVVVTVHWGQEYQSFPSDRQRHLAHLMAAAGADLIVGHHPHVIQSVEMIGKTMVFYSVGNLVFDQTRPECSEALLVQMRMQNRKSVSFHALPLQIRKAQPAPAFPSEAAETLDRLAKLSSSVGFYPEADGWWSVQPLVPP